MEDNGTANQYLVIIHKGSHPIEQIIVTGPESAGRIYLEKYPTAQLLLNLDSESYRRISLYIQSSLNKTE